MKKSIVVSVILNCSLMGNIFGQSLVLTPEKIDQRGGTSDNISLRTSIGSIPNIIGINHGGTLTSPASTSINTSLLNIGGAGFGTSVTFPTAIISIFASENWSNTANGTGISFSTTANGALSAQERLRIGHNGSVGIGLVSPDKILDINGRMRIRHTPGFTSGVWMSNSTNGLTDADGAFVGMENDNKAGIWINNAWRFGVNSLGEISTSSMVGVGNRPVFADANGTLQPISSVAFSAYLGVNFSIPNNNILTIPFGVENYDINNNYNSTTYEFTAPVNGIYNFSTTTTWSSLTATSGNFILELIGPSGTFAQSRFPIYSTNIFSTNTISSDIKLNSGQIVKVRVYQTSGIGLNLAGNFNNYTAIFSGHLVTPL